MTEKAVLTKNVVLFREQNGLTQDEMADECGISKETLSLIERGSGNPTLRTMQYIAARMGRTVSQLLTLEKECEYLAASARNEHSKKTRYDLQAVSNGKVVFAADSIFPDWDSAEKLVDLCNRGYLSPIHINDIIYDWLGK